MVSRYSAYRRGSDTIAPDVIDRILLGACAAVWLALLGVSVAAAVALADLGRGFHKAAGNPHTTWVLYAVIVISALIIAGAIPVLLRARRAADAAPHARVAGRPLVGALSPTTRSAADRARQQHGMHASAPVPGTVSEWSGAAVDRVWLRGTTLLTATMGVALIAVGAATYLMAVGHEGPSWVAYGLAGFVTAAMPVLEWYHVRRLRSVAAAQ